MPAIADAHVLIMATNRFEESELFGPREMLLQRGARVTLTSPTREEVMATVHDEPGRRIAPDLTIDEVHDPVVGDADAGVERPLTVAVA